MVMLYKINILIRIHKEVEKVINILTRSSFENFDQVLLIGRVLRIKNKRTRYSAIKHASSLLLTIIFTEKYIFIF